MVRQCEDINSRTLHDGDGVSAFGRHDGNIAVKVVDHMCLWQVARDQVDMIVDQILGQRTVHFTVDFNVGVASKPRCIPIEMDAIHRPKAG